MKDIKDMTMEEICRHNVNLLTKWNEQHIEEDPDLARENAVEIFKFYINGVSANHLMNQFGIFGNHSED